MEFFEHIAIIVFLAAVALLPLFIVYNVFRLVWEKLIVPSSSLPAINARIFDGKEARKIDYASIKLVLSSKFSYYQRLSVENQSRFVNRVSRFISDKEFRALNFELTEEMIILISASAIQLTFGLDHYLFDHFSKIFIYPREFYSRLNKEYHRGETNLGGVIVLSWKHFSEGYNIPNDNLNLGLHEMAHALRFDKFKSDDYDRFFSEYLDKWQLISKEEFLKIKEHKASFFREYGGTNFSEFFSVCIEYFFESPREFKNMQPEIYKHLCILLNQDPEANLVNINAGKASEEHFASGEPVMTFTNQRVNLVADIFSIPVSCVVLGYLFRDAKSQAVVFMIAALLTVTIVSLLVKIRNSKKKIFVHKNGLRIESAFLKRFDRFFYFDDIVSIILRQENKKREGNMIRLNTLERGKMKTRVVAYSFSSEKEIEEFRKFLLKIYVPVKTLTAD